MVSAWATQNRLTLGQVAVPDGSNEVATIPALLKVLDLSGAIVTIDAAGCQTENARLIRAGRGHYLLAAKGNRPTLHEAVRAVFERADAAGFEGVRFDHHTTIGNGHGRHEERSVSVVYEPTGLPAGWPDVGAVVSVLRERAVGAEVTATVHYYVTSHAGTAAEIAGLIRGHWGIESMHWVPDVVFREDDSRVRAGHAGENLALIRRVAVSLLRRAPGKGSTPTKRLKAGWDDEYLLQVPQGIQAPEVR